ncbi:MFS general substrate transporter [Microthyrium microscopicum]|uniref:MFS general substrate transporter n=1 Tax=Microthyrium microscopicum TaxID=703497 RepID=A0A6A6U3H0_9PEZI|nr:MFS general substrate transporter [Microthyrium microscopicum]
MEQYDHPYTGSDKRPTLADSRMGGDVQIPTGWRYKRTKIGPVSLPYYASPEAQLLLVSFVCFLCPGMFNALSVFGGAGLNDDYASTIAFCATYAALAVVAFFAGAAINALGIRLTICFGSIGYSIFISSIFCYSKTQNLGYVKFASVLLGCCAGVLWAAQGAIIMSYPQEHLKGRFLAWFWTIFNLGGVVGSLVELGLNSKNNSAGKGVSDGTYVAFLLLTFSGACLSWTFLDSKHIVRRDGSRVILMRQPTWKSELLGLWQTLATDPYIIFLFPMFFASNFFYTYHYNDFNFDRFDPRTRALNSTLYWLAQMIGALIFGFALDLSNIRRTTRAKAAWIAMFALTFAIWGGGYVFQRSFTRETKEPGYDWNSAGYTGPMFLYMAYGFYDAAWQVTVYWFMGAITNNGRKLANFAGFYKGIQSAGAAIIWRADGLGAPYMSIFVACWALLAGSLLIALPVMIWKIKDTVPVEEDLKFTDELMEDVMPSHFYDYSVEQK